MTIWHGVARGAMAAVMVLLSGTAGAAVTNPRLDIQDMGSDAGGSLTAKTFTIDATAFTIITDGGPIDIADQVFTLSGSGSYDGTSGSFSGSFSVGGGLLAGSFSTLTVIGLGGADAQFGGDVSYDSGSLMGGFTGGRIEGILSGSAVVAKLGPVVVPAPAALWLLGSGLVALGGIARRKAAG